MITGVEKIRRSSNHIYYFDRDIVNFQNNYDIEMN